MTDLVRMVFDRLHAAGTPCAKERADIYNQCRTEVASIHADPRSRAHALDQLEKVIRRQEMQAIYEETLRDR